jgi:hypothetical protein
MQILTWNEFIALTQTSANTRRFFSKKALATAKRVVPAYYAAVEESVAKASGSSEQVTQRAGEHRNDGCANERED